MPILGGGTSVSPLTPAAFVPLTGDNRIDGLVQGFRWDFGSGPRVLTYTLDYTGFQAGSWSASRIAAVDQAYQAWSNVANIQFQRIGVGGNFFSSPADLAVGLSGNALGSSVLSIGVFPDPIFAAQIRSSSWPRPEGDILLDDAK